MSIKEQLKTEIDRLDDQYLDLLYKIIRQFPHDSKANSIATTGRDVAAICQKIADSGGLGIPNPKQWQRDIRQDRELPTRNS
jgi:hypothetical protein